MLGRVRQHCVWVLMIVAAACLGLADLAHAGEGGSEAIWLIDDFEDGNLDGWIDGNGTCNYFILEDPSTAPEGSKFLEMYQSCGGHRQGLHFGLAGFQAGSIYLYVRSNRVDYSNYVVIDDDSSANNWCVIFFYGTESGTFRAVDHNGIHYDCGPRVADQWYQVRFNIDWDFHTYDVYIDNTLRQAGVPFPVAINTMNWLYLYSLGTGLSMYDYIVASTPPPTPVLFVDGFESGDWAAWSGAVP